MRNFKELDIWKQARTLTKQIYQLSATFPTNEQYGITSQIRRCVISIAANIAEGSAKSSEKDFARFLQISLGSAFELESHLILCSDLEIISDFEADNNIRPLQLLQKKLYSFVRYINAQSAP
ncbi:MAG: four helix bundle protein [Flavobacterium sp.]|nr:MAG: four helix bundle protein [Flavobacterium sp.]